MFDIGLFEVSGVLLFGGIGTMGALLARRKGRSAARWFIYSVLFWPSVVIVTQLKPMKEVQGAYRKCTSCDELVKWKAKVCAHCGAQLSPPDLSA